MNSSCYLAVIASFFLTANALPPIFQIPQSAWISLNQSIGGNLFQGKPMDLPCFTKYNRGTGTTFVSPKASACAAIENGKTDGPTIASYFGGYEVPNWGQCQANSTACSISALAPVDPVSPIIGTCYQGSVPDYYIDSSEPAHMHKGMLFAKKHEIPLVIKNTGHDHRGRSSAPYSLAIWTHNIQPPLVFDEDFLPTGCTKSAGVPTVTYGAGCELGNIYDAAHEHGYMFAGGAALSVGASGGWVQGGGHGAMAMNYGLGVDNVMEMTVLLPNGTVMTANRCQNQDIFFALRGGGGGTFGIVLKTTSRIYKEVPMQYASISFGHLGLDQGSEFFKVLIDNTAALAADGWGAYILPGLLEGTVANFGAITPKLTLKEAKASLRPIVNFANSLTNLTVPVQINITTLPNGYYDFLQTSTANTVGGFTGLSYVLVSRLVPRANFETKASRKELLQVLNKLNRDKQANPNFVSALVPFYILMVTPAAYHLPASDLPGGPGQASVTPAWRDSLWQFEMPTVWDPTDPTAGGVGSIAQAFKDAHLAINPLREITKTSGAYQNEADIFEPDHTTSFWGHANYERLLSIKREIDPDNILTCHQCIGWDPSDPRYGCYPQQL